MANKKVEISLLTSNKSGILASIMRQSNSLGLIYQKHQLVKVDTNLSRMDITFDGDLNCSVDEFTDSMTSHPVIHNVVNINIDNSENAEINSNLESGSPFTILRAHYVITPESLKIAEDNLAEYIGAAAATLVEEEAKNTKHIGDLYLQLSKHLDEKERDSFLSLVSNLKSD